jgi:hypothetical protein
MTTLLSFSIRLGWPYPWTLLNFIALLIGLVAGFSLESAEASLGPKTFIAANSLGASLEVEGGAHRMFRDGVDYPTLKIDAWSMDGAQHEVRVKFQIEDIFNKPTQTPEDVRITLPADGTKVERTITFEPGLGYFNLTAKFKSESSEVTRWLDLGVVARPFSGPRPNSFFGSNTSGLKKGMDLELLERIGMKVERAHFAPPVQTQDPNWPFTLPSGQAVALNFSQADKNWESTKAHGLWVLPVVGYSLAGAGNFDRTDLARKLGMYGPPGDRQRFISTWETILRRYPEITTYEFWNEPWIFGWSWAGTPADYRQLQRDWCAMALRVNPQNTIIAGNSTMFVRDNIEPYPEWWRGFLGGISHHPYTRSVGEESFRAGDNLRSIDDCVLTARQMGLEHAFLTEGGTNFESARPKAEEKPFNNLENASKIVQYYVSAALSGVFMGNAQWGIGYGPDWTRSNTAFAVLTQFLEDRVPLVDLWPEEELLWGGIFANARFADEEVKALPRAPELTARWNVEVPPERSSSDTTKVAVLWSLTGPSATQLDEHGELVVPDASGLRAFDLTGREILPVEGAFVLPFTPVPVYLTTDNLSVMEFRKRIIQSKIEHLTPLNLYALSLSRGAEEKQSLSVRIQNQLNRPVNGTLSLRIGQPSEESKTRFAIEAGCLSEVEIGWPGTAASSDNKYAITLTARLESDQADPSDLPVVARDQTIAVARFAKRTVSLNGSVDDLKGMTPVVVDSQDFEKVQDPTRQLLNPNLEAPAQSVGRPRIVARVGTAYDDANVYVMAVVNEDQFHCQAGQPVALGENGKKVTLSYKEGMPDGLRFITYCGNVLQFSFGFRDRVPGIGRQMSDPWAWKGCFYDTDYSFVAHVSTQGDQLIHIWGPESSRQDGYQTEAVPGIGPVPGAKVKITRDESQKLTVYEIAIPRHELTLFDPGAGRCRFGFILYNSEQAAGGSLNWSDAGGVFDYWRSSGSFPPTWNQRLPCQTFFGIEQ